MKTKKKVLLFILVVLLVAGLGYFAYNYFYGEDRVAKLERYLKENWANYVIDGSTSMIPLHEALEAKFGEGKEIEHSRTVAAFENFVDGEIDILLAVDYLDSYFEAAKEKNVEINKKEITKEALVFLRNKDFDQESLTLDQIKGIFNREITKWTAIDPKHRNENDFIEEIVPIYRNEDSGSGMAMLRLLEKDSIDCSEESCKFIGTMSGIINALATGLEGEYGQHLIAFNMYTFTEKQYNHENVRTFKIDGIAPNDDTIYNEEYPIILYNYIYYKNDEAKEFGEKLHEYLMTDVGQRLIMENGYVPIRKQNNAKDQNNERNCQDNFVDEMCVRHEGWNEEIKKFVKIEDSEKYSYFDTVEEYIFANSSITQEEFNTLSNLLKEIIDGIKKMPGINIYDYQGITLTKQTNRDIILTGGNCGGVPCIIFKTNESYNFGSATPEEEAFIYNLFITRNLRNIYSNKRVDEQQMEFNIPIGDFSKAFKITSGM